MQRVSLPKTQGKRWGRQRHRLRDRHRETEREQLWWKEKVNIASDFWFQRQTLNPRLWFYAFRATWPSTSSFYLGTPFFSPGKGRRIYPRVTASIGWWLDAKCLKIYQVLLTLQFSVQYLSHRKAKDLQTLRKWYLLIAAGGYTSWSILID